MNLERVVPPFAYQILRDGRLILERDRDHLDRVVDRQLCLHYDMADAWESYLASIPERLKRFERLEREAAKAR